MLRNIFNLYINGHYISYGTYTGNAEYVYTFFVQIVSEKLL